MSKNLREYISPRRRKQHETMTILDRSLKEGYRNGTLVRSKKERRK